MPLPESPPLVCTAPARLSEAEELSAGLGLQLAERLGVRGAALVLTETRLELRQLGEGAPGPVWAEWVEGSARHRRLHGRERGSTLARAIGLGKSGQATPLRVVDATAGLGRDAFVLACLGCHVRAIERAPAMFALLRDAHRRAAADPEVAAILDARLTVELGDAREVLADLQAGDRPAVILLDPMFPPRRPGRALVKKQMRVTRLVTGDDPDAGELLAIARTTATSRVVVKRPRGAPPLAGEQPTVTYEGKTTRYDAYMIRKRA